VISYMILILSLTPLSILCQTNIPANPASVLPTEMRGDTAVAVVTSKGDTAVMIPYKNAVEYFNLKKKLWPKAVNVIDSLRSLSAEKDLLLAGKEEESKKYIKMLEIETQAKNETKKTLNEIDAVLRKKQISLRLWRIWGITMTGTAGAFAIALALQ
jgi:hypothetical protein